MSDGDEWVPCCKIKTPFQISGLPIRVLEELQNGKGGRFINYYRKVLFDIRHKSGYFPKLILGNSTKLRFSAQPQNNVLLKKNVQVIFLSFLAFFDSKVFVEE